MRLFNGLDEMGLYFRMNARDMIHGVRFGQPIVHMDQHERLRRRVARLAFVELDLPDGENPEVARFLFGRPQKQHKAHKHKRHAIDVSLFDGIQPLQMRKHEEVAEVESEALEKKVMSAGGQVPCDGRRIVPSGPARRHIPRRYAASH